MNAQDFLLDDNGDLLIVDDDVVMGPSDEQHIQDILVSYPGEWKQNPLCGVNLKRGVNGLINGAIERDIRMNLIADGYQVNNVTITTDQLLIDATRNS